MIKTIWDGGWGLGGRRHPSPLNQWCPNLEGYMKDSCSKCEECDSKLIRGLRTTKVTLTTYEHLLFLVLL